MARAQGIDVSSYQPPLYVSDLDSLDFAFTRVSYWDGIGMGTDPDLASNWATMKQAKIHRGAYWFFMPNVDAKAQARYFAEAMKKVELEPGDMLVCDSETPNAHANSATKEFCDELVSLVGTQNPVLIYTNYEVGHTLTSCADYPLWFAYPEPVEPSPGLLTPWKEWKFWQHSWKPADKDVYHGTAAELQTWLDDYLIKRELVHWRTNGHFSFNEEAKMHFTSTGRMLEIAAKEHHVYTGAMAEYLKENDFDKKMPADVELFRYKEVK